MAVESEPQPEAYVDGKAKIGNGVTIGRFTEVLAGSIIDDDSIIGCHCVIGHPSKLELQDADFSATSPKVSDLIVKEPTTKIGRHAIIRSGSTIYQHVIIGKNLRTGHNVLIREHVTIGDNCIVGTQAVLDGYIKIGPGSMIQSQCYLAQSVRIGEGVFIAPDCVFVDNRKIILGHGLDAAVVKNYVRVGAGSIILPGLTIGEYAQVGAGSVVTRDIPSKAVVIGAPAKVQRTLTQDEIRAYVDSVKAWNF